MGKEMDSKESGSDLEACEEESNSGIATLALTSALFNESILDREESDDDDIDL